MKLKQSRVLVTCVLALIGTVIITTIVLLTYGVENLTLDLRVYQVGGKAVLQLNDDLYSLKGPRDLPFTYPPFAAILFAPLSLLPGLPAMIVVYLLSVLCLLRIGFLTFDALKLNVNDWTVGLISLLAMGLEPICHTFTFGQVNLFIVWAVMEDLLGPSERKWRGVLVGLAMGFKLTPGIFLLYLLVTKQWRAGLVAACAGAVSGILGLILLPKSSWDYWTGVAFDSSRVGGVAYVSNQSLQGIVWRFVGEGGNSIVYYGLALIVLIFAGYFAVKLLSNQQVLESVLVAAIAGILVSPISWSHHFVWVYPLVVCLCAGFWQIQKTGLRIFGLSIAVWTFLTSASYLMWVLPHGSNLEYDWVWWQHLLGNCHAIACILSLVWFGWIAISTGSDKRAKLAVH